MADGDIQSAHDLSRRVGWGHRLEDWRLLFELGEGIIAQQEDGTVQGVALWWPYGPHFATFGMVIVSPDAQGTGVGRSLMTALLSAADGRRVLLNATAPAVRLYESLGFVPTGGISTHSGSLLPDIRLVGGADDVRELQEADWPAIHRIDREASGMERLSLLSALKSVSRGWVMESSGRIVGYSLRRNFGHGSLIGPLVANSESAALALLSASARGAGGIVRVDIPSDATELAHWLEQAGLVWSGQVTTMWRPGPMADNQQSRIFGLAAQALG